MNKKMLGALLDAKDLTLDELRAKDPALADKVVSLVRQAEGAHLKDSLGDLPEHVRAKVAEIDVTRATGDAVEHLRVNLVEFGVEPEHVQKVVHRAHKARLGHGLKPKQVIGTEPAVAAQLATARVHEVSAVAGLRGAAADAVARAAAAPSALDEATLTRLVAEKKLTEVQARNVGFSAALYELLDDNAALAKAIPRAAFHWLAGETPSSTADLAKLSAADLTEILASTEMKAALPAGATPESAGATLASRFAALHPGVALLARLPQINVGRVTAAVQDLAPLFQHNSKVVGASFSDLDTRGLSAAQIEQCKTSQAQLVQLTRPYPGLELGAILDDPSLSPRAKA